jgi:hypothetical protein
MALIMGRPAAVDWFRRRYDLSREELTWWSELASSDEPAPSSEPAPSGEAGPSPSSRAVRYLDRIYAGDA